MFFIYMLRCKDNSIYTGITTDLGRRFNEHKTGNSKCAKYTKTHGAIKMECAWYCENRAQASKLEYHIKKLNKEEKESLIINKNLYNYFSEKIDCESYKVAL